MALRQTIYVDITSGEVVTSDTNSRSVPLPKIVQGDLLLLRIYLLQRSADYPSDTPYTVFSNAGVSLSVTLGPKTGTAGSSLYAQALAVASVSPYQFWDVDLPLNTAAIATLIGSAESKTAWLEFEALQGGYPWTPFQKEVTIHAEVYETGTLAVPAGLTAASVEYVNATFLTRENTGFILTNPNTGGKVQCYLGDDGVVHWDPIA